jgi:hypothetical protein
VYKILAGKSEWKIGLPLGRPRCRWEDNIKIDLKKYGVRVWSGLVWLKI